MEVLGERRPIKRKGPKRRIWKKRRLGIISSKIYSRIWEV